MLIKRRRTIEGLRSQVWYRFDRRAFGPWCKDAVTPATFGRRHALGSLAVVRLCRAGRVLGAKCSPLGLWWIFPPGLILEGA